MSNKTTARINFDNKTWLTLVQISRLLITFCILQWTLLSANHSVVSQSLHALSSGFNHNLDTYHRFLSPTLVEKSEKPVPLFYLRFSYCVVRIKVHFDYISWLKDNLTEQNSTPLTAGTYHSKIILHERVNTEHKLNFLNIQVKPVPYHV